MVEDRNRIRYIALKFAELEINNSLRSISLGNTVIITAGFVVVALGWEKLGLSQLIVGSVFLAYAIWSAAKKETVLIKQREKIFEQIGDLD